MSRAEAVRGSRDILDGRYDTLPEQAFPMAGDIASVERKARERDTP